MTSHTNRVVVLVDMDCFYCQVEEKLEPKLAGKPIAVVQYNAWKGGGIIAVNYPARDRGVTRHMRGDEAKAKCPEIELVRVPNVRGKADLTKYREAGKRVAEVLQTFTPLLQRASVDEAYLDITEEVNKRLTSKHRKLTIDKLMNTHVVGCETKDFLYNVYDNELDVESNLKLAVGGAIVEEVRAAVYNKTGYRCSAGIAHNKILAKLACGLHKPNKQTILPQDGVQELYKDLPIRKIKSLGGKFGNSLSEGLNITNMGELIKFTERELLKKFDEKTALWLYNIARGIDTEPVTVRLVSNSIGCCKKFPGKTALKTVDQVTHWLSELATEISERLEQDLEENSRRAKQIVVSFAQEVNRKDVHSSRTLPLNSYDAKKIVNDSFKALQKYAQKPDGTFRLKFLGISVGKFQDCKNVNDIHSFFKPTNKTTDTQQNIASESKKPTDITNLFNNMNKQTKGTNLNEIQEQEVNKNEEQTDDGSLNLSDIEDDADNNSEMNLDETIKDIQNIKHVISEDAYSEDTLELDFSEQLKNKQEFPNFSTNETSNSTNSTKNKKKISSTLNKSDLGDTSKSFFIKYAKKIENVQKSPVHTDLPVSYFDLDAPGCSNQQNIIILDNSDNSNSRTDANVYTENSNSSSVFDNMETVCSECNEKILRVDLISHMDHHMAVKLMAEEKKLFQEELLVHKQKTVVKSPVKKVQVTKTKSVKRKSNVVDKNGSIVSFFSRNLNKENDDMTMCSDCNKPIANADFACHLDYHAAKKLHLELNPVKFGGKTETRIIVNKKKNNCATKNTSGIANISKFFKPVE